jgi:hypothetical protein
MQLARHVGHPTSQSRVDETTRRRLRGGALAGLLATGLMSALLLAAPSLSGEATVAASARVVALVAGHHGTLLLALLVHFTYGSLAGALFAVTTPRGGLGSGLFYGLILWGISVAVYAPLIGAGFLGRAEPALAALILPAHLLYGAVLGASAPRGEIQQPLFT